MKKIIYIFLILLLLTAVFFAFKNKNTGQINFENNIDPFFENSNSMEVLDPDIKKVNDTFNTYFHKKYSFSFDYLSIYKTSNFIEGDGEQIHFQADNGDWFQIYVTPWDEGSIITPERIRKDLPNIVIKEPQQVVLGPKQKDGVGPQALIFLSKDGTSIETREIWFVERGYLFQITTFKRLDPVIGNILSTLVFK